MKFLLIAYISTLFVVCFCLAEEGCHYEETDHKWKVGEVYRPPGECILLECLAPNQFKEQNCVAMGCPHIPDDYPTEYPLCCKTWDCDNNK